MKRKLIERNLSKAQTKYELKKKDITQQSSYNLDLPTENALKSANAIVEIGNTGKYKVNDEYTVVLEKGIIDIIGSEYNNTNNEVIFIHTEAQDGTTKFQIKRKDNSSEKCSWFQKLYDNNIEGSKFIVYLDVENKKILFDNKIPKEKNDYYLELTDQIASEQQIDVVGNNKIYYGIPGCGKSYKIKKDLEAKNVPQENIFRTTFYLDYSNSDFVGQILPKVEGKDVKYEYNPGPFTKALTRAFNTNDMVYLIIEEINRGNAAAIFGDLFQLLDRKKEDDSYGPSGESEYPITNEFIESYLKKNVSGGYHKELIYIPNNLTILATMNTSDQNVFPLDTAFKRRWDMERVKGDINACEFKDYYIPYTSIKWCEFQEQVNKQITISASNGLITEDKQLGPWFASKDMFVKEKNQGDKKKLEKFVYNVMDYIYNDVCKFEKEGWFIGNVSFADICNSILEHPDKENVSENLCLAFLKKYTDNKESNDDQS